MGVVCLGLNALSWASPASQAEAVQLLADHSDEQANLGHLLVAVWWTADSLQEALLQLPAPVKMQGQQHSKGFFSVQVKQTRTHTEQN